MPACATVSLDALPPLVTTDTPLLKSVVLNVITVAVLAVAV
jgi:hypothetical protein